MCLFLRLCSDEKAFILNCRGSSTFILFLFFLRPIFICIELARCVLLTLYFMKYKCLVNKKCTSHVLLSKEIKILIFHDRILDTCVCRHFHWRQLPVNLLRSVRISITKVIIETTLDI